MKKIMSIILFIISITFITACQPTPETPPIVGKGDDHLEEMIASSAVSPLPEETASSLAKVVGAPKTFKDSYTNNKGDVTVTIDANVVVPSVEALPALQVKISDFSQEQVDKFGGYFLKRAPLFSEEQVRTKSEIETSIINEEQYLQDLKRRFTGVRDDEIEESERYLEELKKQYSQAPEKRERMPATLELQSDEHGTSLYVLAELGKDAEASFCISNSNVCNIFEFDNDGKGGYDPYSDMTGKQKEAPRGMKTTREEAEKIMSQCLSDLGIEDMQIESVSAALYYSGDTDSYDKEYKASAKQCYAFSLTKTVRGIPVHIIEGSTPFGTDDPNVPAPQEPDYNLVRDPEKLEILVDDTGIVGFQWTNPTQEVEVLSEHVTLLPFEDVMQRAKENIFFKNYTAYGSTSDIKITSIKLGMMRIARKDKPGEYLMVPVWDFIGNRTSGLAGHEDWLPFGGQSFVTINAIDGSMIHRDWGY